MASIIVIFNEKGNSGKWEDTVENRNAPYCIVCIYLRRVFFTPDSITALNLRVFLLHFLDSTKPSGPLVQNGHHGGASPLHLGRLSNGGGGGGGGSAFVNSSSLAKMSMSPKLQTSRAVWLFNDLYTALKSLENPSAIFEQLPADTQEYFVKWLSNSSQAKVGQTTFPC